MTSSPGSPAVTQLRHNLENGRPLGPTDLQAQLIKSEPTDFNDYHLLIPSQSVFGGPGVYMNGQSGLLGIQSSSQSTNEHLGGLGVDFPQLEYMGHFGTNLSEVQKVLAGNSVYRQMTDGNPEEISKLRAYIKELGDQMDEQKLAQCSFQASDHSSPTKNITDYTLEKVGEAKTLIDNSTNKKQKNVQKENPNHSTDLSSGDKPLNSQNQFLPFSCQYCKETFSGPIPLHQHERYLCEMNEEIKAVLQPAESIPSGHMGEAASEQSGNDRVMSPISYFKDHISVLKAYIDMNTEPSSEELLKISVAVGLPQEFFRAWFAQWKKQNHQGGCLKIRSPPPDCSGLDITLSRSSMLVPALDLPRCFTKANQFTPSRRTTGEKPQNQLDHMRSNTPSPLNLSSTSSKNSQSCPYTPNSLVSEDAHRETPLDLSLPKHMAKQPQPHGYRTENNGDIQQGEQLSGSLDLVNLKKEVLGSESGGNTVSQLERSSSPIFGINPFAGSPVYTSLPPHGAFPPSPFMSPAQATIPGLRPYPGYDHMTFLPHMAYAYGNGAATFAERPQRRKYQQKPGFQVRVK